VVNGLFLNSIALVLVAFTRLPLIKKIEN